MADLSAIQVQIQNALIQAGISGQGLDTSALAQQIAALPQQYQGAMLNNLLSTLATSGGGSLSQSNLDTITSSVQQTATQIQNAYQAQAPAAQVASPVAPTSASPGTAASNPLSASGTSNPYTAPLSVPGGETVAAGSAASSGGTSTGLGNLPTGVNLPAAPATNLAAELKAYQNISKGAAMPQWGGQLSSDPAYLAGYLGVSPDQVVAGYQQYLQQGGVSGDQHAALDAHLSGGSTATDQVRPGLSLPQWVAEQVTTIEGKYAPILNAYEYKWEQINNAPMPAELRTALRSQIGSLAPEQQAELDAKVQLYLQDYQSYASAGSGTSESTKQGFLDSAVNAITGSNGLIPLEQVFTNYGYSHPNLAADKSLLDQQNINNFISQYHTITGTMPTQDQIDSAVKMNSTDLATYYDNLPMGTVPLTYGAYQASLNNLLNASGSASNSIAGWQNIFGKDPTPQQVYQFHGKSKADIQAYIDNSPSRLPGETIGTYSNLQQAGQDISTKLFGQANSDQLLQLFASSGAQK